MELNLGNQQLLTQIKAKQEIQERHFSEAVCPLSTGDETPCRGPKCVAYRRSLLPDNTGRPTLHFWSCSALGESLSVFQEK